LQERHADESFFTVQAKQEGKQPSVKIVGVVAAAAGAAGVIVPVGVVVPVGVPAGVVPVS